MGIDMEVKESSTPEESPPARLQAHMLADVLNEDKHFEWLVRGIWTCDGFGEIAGAEKTLKSYLSTLLAISTASAEPFLGRFPVVRPGPVVWFTGEGSRHLATCRLRHLVEMYEYPDDVIGACVSRIAIIEETAPILSERFMNTLQHWLSHKPVLVIIDPLYSYFGGDAEASNVYSAAEVLQALSGPTVAADCALVVVNHTRKVADAHWPSLTDITQAGHREWVANWIMVHHTEPPDLAEQSFRLGLEVGSREGFGGRYVTDLNLGALDEDGNHQGTPTVAVEDYTETSAESKISEQIDALFITANGKLTKGEFESRVHGTAAKIRADLAVREMAGQIEWRPEKRTGSDRKMRTVQVAWRLSPSVLPSEVNEPDDDRP